MTSQTLLYKILDYKANWDMPDFEDSPPARARLQQINCLLDAFGLTKDKSNIDPERAKSLANTSNLQYVVSGQFLNVRPLFMYQELMEESIEKVKHIYPEEDRAFYRLRFSLKPMFKELYSFRMKVFKASDRTSGVIEGFMTGVAYAEALRADVIDVLEANIAPVDRVLGLLLDPLNSDLDKGAMGYPEYDFEEIDLEWLVERL